MKKIQYVILLSVWIILSVSGLPEHTLALKIGDPIILMRNLYILYAMYNLDNMYSIAYKGEYRM